MQHPWRLKELHPPAVAERLAARPAMLVPVGTTEPHGQVLPLGCDTLIVEAVADGLSARHGVLRAPTVEYGVGSTRRPGRGGASLRRKTLHRVMNELVHAWEDAGVSEFVVLTAEGNEAHLEALSSIVVAEARLVAVDIFAMDFGDLLEVPEPSPHGSELDTSLLLHLVPGLIRADQPLPAGASAAKGERIYQFILDRIGTHCFAGDDT